MEEDPSLNSVVGYCPACNKYFEIFQYLCKQLFNEAVELSTAISILISHGYINYAQAQHSYLLSIYLRKWRTYIKTNLFLKNKFIQLKDLKLAKLAAQHFGLPVSEDFIRNFLTIAIPGFGGDFKQIIPKLSISDNDSAIFVPLFSSPHLISGFGIIHNNSLDYYWPDRRVTLSMGIANFDLIGIKFPLKVFQDYTFIVSDWNSWLNIQISAIQKYGVPAPVIFISEPVSYRYPHEECWFSICRPGHTNVYIMQSDVISHSDLLIFKYLSPFVIKADKLKSISDLISSIRKISTWQEVTLKYLKKTGDVDFVYEIRRIFGRDAVFRFFKTAFPLLRNNYIFKAFLKGQQQTVLIKGLVFQIMPSNEVLNRRGVMVTNFLPIIHTICDNYYFGTVFFQDCSFEICLDKMDFYFDFCKSIISQAPLPIKNKLRYTTWGFKILHHLALLLGNPSRFRLIPSFNYEGLRLNHQIIRNDGRIDFVHPVSSPLGRIAITSVSNPNSVHPTIKKLLKFLAKTVVYKRRSGVYFPNIIPADQNTYEVLIRILRLIKSRIFNETDYFKGFKVIRYFRSRLDWPLALRFRPELSKSELKSELLYLLERISNLIILNYDFPELVWHYPVVGIKLSEQIEESYLNPNDDVLQFFLQCLTTEISKSRKKTARGPGLFVKYEGLVIAAPRLSINSLAEIKHVFYQASEHYGYCPFKSVEEFLSSLNYLILDK